MASTMAIVGATTLGIPELSRAIERAGVAQVEEARRKKIPKTEPVEELAIALKSNDLKYSLEELSAFSGPRLPVLKTYRKWCEPSGLSGTNRIRRSRRIKRKHRR